MFLSTLIMNVLDLHNSIVCLLELATKPLPVLRIGVQLNRKLSSTTCIFELNASQNSHIRIWA